MADQSPTRSLARHATRAFALAVAAATALYAGEAFAARPLAGVASIASTTPRAGAASMMLEAHLNNVLASTGVFEQINPRVLADQLTRFDCLEDSCVLRFARRAGIHVLFRGKIEDRGACFILTLYALAIHTPYEGREAYRYRVRIRAGSEGLGAREFSYILEEHAGRFIAGFLSAWRYPLPVAGGYPAEWPSSLEGAFPVCRYGEAVPAGEPVRPFTRVGSVSIRNHAFHAASGQARFHDDDFVLVSRIDSARTLSDFYRGRKRELVLAQSSLSDTLSVMLFTVPASATMPLTAPLFGYAATGDYRGLGLWAVNAAPYLYLEYRGLNERPSKLEDDRRDIERDDYARHRFALYMLFAGGMSLFADAFASHSLSQAAYYQGAQPYIGNSLTAAYLSLVSGGGGHFYRGSRAWGYFYFHVNNALVYLTLRSFAPERRYDDASESWSEERADRRKGYAFAASLALVKIIEITHVLLFPDHIDNGEMLEERASITPVALLESGRGGIILGAQISMRW